MTSRFLGFFEIVGLLLSAIIVLLGLFVHRVFFAAFLFVGIAEVLKVTYLFLKEDK